jgi:plasmid stabilization system protein ParE
MSSGASSRLPVFFETPATQELIEARDWYNRQRPGMGEKFLDEVERITDLLREHPYLGPAVSPLSRSVRMKERFPYRIVYQVLSDHIRIIAVAHSRRRAMYWRPRER